MTRPARLARWRTEAGAWASGRNPWVRLPLLAWLAWVFARHLGDADYASIFAGLNLGIHELGHFVFAPLGEFMAIAGGTLLQCLAPVIAAFMFRRQGDWFAIAFALCWLGTNAFAIAPYAADARAQELPLVSPIDGVPVHDWYYLLERTRLLEQDYLVSGLFRLAGMACMAAGLGFGVWLLLIMYRTRGQAPTTAG
jgi:hypothetical protein